MTHIKSISVSDEFANLAVLHSVSWTEAARVGMAILLAEKGVAEYDNKLNIYRKMNFFREEAEKNSQKVEEMMRKLEKKTEILPKTP